MAQDFDNFPLYDDLLKTDEKGKLSNKMSDLWVAFVATFTQNLTGYLSQNGIFVPRVTTAQRDDLQNVMGGQLIYNTSLEKFQGYENGAWVNLV